MDKKEVMKVLSKNEHLNFVRRILAPGINPVLHNKGNSVSTHSMATGEDENGVSYAYPEVIQRRDGTMTRLTGEEAWHHAEKTGERIAFKDRKESESFAKSYKKVWTSPKKISDGYR